MAHSVLLVEQDQRLLPFTAYQLASLDLELIAVENPARALELVRSRTFDRLIVDVDRSALPLGDPRGVLPGHPLVLLSDHVADREEREPSGFRILQKPFKRAEQSATVQRALEARASRPEAPRSPSDTETTGRRVMKEGNWRHERGLAPAASDPQRRVRHAGGRGVDPGYGQTSEDPRR